MNFGTRAEYKCLSQDSIMALKPASISYEEAAACPGAGLALFLKKSNQRGQADLRASARLGQRSSACRASFGADVTG
jgi:NADPH:quinone reductase-like Zn-dependent oxidoreductase